MRKKAKVIMLPTDKAEIKVGDIVKRNNSSLPIQLCTNPLEEDGRLVRLEWVPQHLYLTSDEEIKEGDYYYLETTGRGSPSGVYKCKTEVTAKMNTLSVNCSKIIATTDKSLRITTSRLVGDTLFKKDKKLPGIPTSFIEAYVKAEGKIDEVMVEYKCGRCNMVDGHKLSCKDEYLWSYIPNTREDNTVIIHKCKDNMYSREELILISEYVRVGAESNPTMKTIDLIKEYEENL